MSKREPAKKGGKGAIGSDYLRVEASPVDDDRLMSELESFLQSEIRVFPAHFRLTVKHYTNFPRIYKQPAKVDYFIALSQCINSLKSFNLNTKIEKAMKSIFDYKNITAPKVSGTKGRCSISALTTELSFLDSSHIL